MQLSVACRNAVLNSVETTIGTSPKLQIWSGTIPASCATADGAGTKLAEMNLPSDWLADAASGQKIKSGTFEDTNADATGTASHFRIKDSAGTTCHMQGSITATGGGGDMEFDSLSITAGQHITITSFTLNAGNA
jgi:hypothetical protein